MIKNRVVIGRNFLKQPDWKHFIGVPLIYLPLITTVPFVIIGVLIIRLHLKLVGGTNIKTYWDFVPSWLSHRYVFKTQIAYTSEAKKYQFRNFRLYWIFNCKLYCPLSVALFRYCAYLVMIVENWWCPFKHDKKAEYAEGAVDQSYWHIRPAEYDLLDPEDRDNPIWNDQSPKA